MKKILYLFVAIAAMTTVSSCSSDDDGGGSGSLKIGSSTFTPSTNTDVLLYNTTDVEAGTDVSVRYFSLILGSMTSPSYLELEVSYNTATGIDGTYAISNTIMAGKATVSFETPELAYDSTPAQGTLKVKDLGNNQFRLEFNSVSLADIDNISPTIVAKGTISPFFSPF
ncbi:MULTISPECIES: hypothetical protein [unclassified Flavobacterium]|uniref:hypothetical protein n=1 Tax=unclassified Flavobacterium TaxID=196869 RepID=UPI001F136FB3|nr:MULTISPECIES: hypothetical protein [unclassified Flavobacterium]UMY65329.1 hypothetical protein MKO97_12570 [Flavobacterium sp. HJ-32-4]